MAVNVVRYLLEGNGTVPTFVANGGYWPVGGELVGVAVDDAIWHVPATVKAMTKAELVTRLAGMSLADRDGTPLDADAQLEMLNAWLEMVGLPDLA